MTFAQFARPLSLLVQNHKYIVIKNISCFLNTRPFPIKNPKIKKMPKDLKSDIRSARLLKQKANEKWQKTVPAVTYLQVMGSGSNGSPRSLHVFTDHRMYLFNCGEGTQRMAYEHKIKVAKLEHIFITYKSWDNVGGLPGLTLTVQDIGIPRIQLHGPPGIEEIYHLTNGFLITRHTDIAKHEYWEKSFEDGALKIQYVPIFGPKKDNLIKINTEDSSDEHTDCDSVNEKKRPLSPCHESSNKRRNAHSELDNRDMSIAYICKLHNKPGELNMEKCKKFGIPVGPCLGKLKEGYDVTLPNGTIVKSADVVSPEELGPIFIVIECPSEDFLDSLLTAEQFIPHQNVTSSDKDFVELIIHFTPEKIMEDPKYKAWMQRFPPETKHVVLNETFCGISNAAPSRIQHKLNLIHPDIFPILEYEKDTVHQMQPNVSTEDGAPIVAEPCLQYYLRPNIKFQRNRIVTIEPETYKAEVESNSDCLQKLSELKSSLSKMVINGEKYPEITFLGTGSSIPSKVRNVSAILIALSSQCNILLDCGEGTYSQMLKLFGSESTLDILKNLSSIYVSHVHADHHLGLLKILFERRKAFQNCDKSFKPFTLLAPEIIQNWLISYSNTFQPILNDFIMIPNRCLQNQKHMAFNQNYKHFLSETSLQKVETTLVLHCKDAYGVALTLLDGRKIVYSGDTMPCDDLVKIGKNCDVLIHEATMEDDLIEKARLKWHSTTSGAISIGKSMEAKFTVLTHFSQRYAKIPLFNENFHNSVGVAFDNMKLSWNNMHLIPLFIPVIKLIFSQDYELMEESREKQLRRQVQTENQVSVSNDNLEI